MARRKGPRGLREEEQALWRQIAKQTNPLHPERRTPTAKLAPSAPSKPAISKPDLTAFRIGARVPDTAAPNDLQPPLGKRVASLPVRMDAKAFGRMKRGKLPVEGRVDLHGLTLAEAHPRLTGFILDAHMRGHRLVLVITGKGRDRDEGGPIPSRRGALRHQVPAWLTSGPLRPIVLQISEAHRSHGGSGAFYVYLRRSGK